MEVVYGALNPDFKDNETACALGFFDGVHIGHQNLVSILKQTANKHNLKSMIFTFERHPTSILNNMNGPKLITDNAAKEDIFRKLGVDILNFSKVDNEFLCTEPEDFLHDVLIKRFNVKAIITGFNFKFGFKGRGNSNLLQEFGSNAGVLTKIVDPVCIDGALVSSTAIRDFINKGKISMANKFLGRCFSISGSVIHGKRRGHKLGYPTANITTNNEIIIPKNGVYVTKVFVEGIQKIGITNVGYNPTFGSNPMSIETHIIDFQNDIYDKNITVEFHDIIRDEISFDSLNMLSKQINDDKSFAIAYFTKH